MKIAVVSTPIFQLPVSGYSGLEVIAYEQAKGLAARGHDVLLVAPDNSTCPGCQVIPCGPAGQVDERMAWGGFPEVKDDKGNVTRRQHGGYWQALMGCEVVLDHSWSKWSYSLKAEGVLKAPVLGWFHAPVHTMYQLWPPNYPRMAPVEKACPVCISEDQATHFRSLHNRPAQVCYNGFDPDFYQPIPGLRRAGRYLFLARFSTIKGADQCLEACWQAGVGLDLVGDTTITGEPGYLEHCKQLAERASPGWDPARGRQFVIHGGCPRGETVGWYSRAKALIHSAFRFREPFGLAPVEAMACGCPVLASDNGALRETITDGCGWLLKTPEDLAALLKLIETGGPNYLNSMRSRCRENALRFTAANMVKRVEELCQLAIKEPW